MSSHMATTYSSNEMAMKWNDDEHTLHMYLYHHLL
jgi:hypothetical protein